MRALIVGGGPGGLFLATLLRRRFPDSRVAVHEQNPKGVTYGAGVAFTDAAITRLGESAPDVMAALADNVRHDGMTIQLDGVAIPVEVGSAHFNARWSLLSILEGFAVADGVEIVHESDLAVTPATLDDWDLVVGADGVNSRTRETFSAEFDPDYRTGTNWLAWYRTSKPTPLSILLQNRPEGAWMSHTGRFAEGWSNFTVEIGDDIYRSAGFADMTEEESLVVCERVFASYLDGHRLQNDHSPWFQAKFVQCRRWSHRNLVLIGDALHTVHPSIGSGTRFAMRDAAELVNALAESPDDVDLALERFERGRRPSAEAFQRAALRSISWYEALPRRTITDPVKFALEYTMRTGRVPYAEFRRQNPDLIGQYETVFDPRVPALA